MGYSVRVDGWRYTAWFAFEAPSPTSPSPYGRPLVDQLMGRELYDHQGDQGLWLDWPGEYTNVATDPANAQLVKQLHGRVLEYIRLY